MFPEHTALTLFRMGIFWAAPGLGGGPPQKGPLLKICHTYPTIMKLGTVKLYLKKIKKIYESCDTLLEFCWHQHFKPKISKFFYIQKYRYRVHSEASFSIVLTLFKSLKIVLINMITIFMISAKWLLQVFLKYRYFRIKFFTS